MKLRLNSKIDPQSNDAGLFGLYRWYHAREGMTLQLHPTKVVILMLIMAVITYAAAVGGAYYLRSQRPYNQITLTDIALFPLRWEKIQENAGRTNLEHGKALFEDKKFGEAMHMLRAGLRRAPDDHEARKMLAIIYQAKGNSEDATNVLGIGLDYGYPNDREYVDILIALLALREDYSAIGDIARKLRHFPQTREDPERWKKLAELELNSLKRERNFEEMLEYAHEMQVMEPDSPQYKDLEVLALTMLGFEDEAQALLDETPLARQHSPYHRYLQSLMAMQASQLETMDELQDDLMRWPTRPYILQAQMIIELDHAGLEERRDQRIQDYFELYEANPPAMETGVRLFNEHLSIEQIDDILSKLEGQGADSVGIMRLYAIQARLLAGQAKAAQDYYQMWVQDERVGKQLSQYDWLKQLLLVVTQKREDDRKTLWDMTRDKRYPNAIYIASVQALLAGNDLETAERIAENGLLYYPHNQQLAELRRQAASGR